MNRLIFAMLFLTGCGQEFSADIIGEYKFQGLPNMAKTTCPGTKSSKFRFNIVSEEEIILPFDESKPLLGEVTSNSFDVTGENPWAKEMQSLHFVSEDISSKKATAYAVMANNPFCFAVFEGTFENK